MNKYSYLSAPWINKPDNVHAVTTLRTGGQSQGQYADYNLAMHVGDDMLAVENNRNQLMNDLHLPSEPIWLEQVHSDKVFNASRQVLNQLPHADASVTQQKGVVCTVMTADCLPVFFCNQAGTEVAVAHAGWRGLHAGIISNTVKAMKSSASEIFVSLGPAIGAQSFEVGVDVFSAFVSKNPLNESAFIATSKEHFLCDIYCLAKIELLSLGIEQIAGGDSCTYVQNQQFYSFRREGITGRMASLIWMSE